MKSFDTIIIGGGVAGLGCARTLHEHGKKDFIVITKDIGGRAPRSDKKDPLASFYARSDYENLRPYLKLGRKATPWKGCLICQSGRVWRAIPILLRHPVEALRFLLLMRKYDKHYQQFMQRCTKESQKQALEKDPFLLKLYTQTGWECVKEWKIEQIAQVMIRTLVRTTGFIDMDTANGFIMCWIWQIAIRRTRECTVDIEKLTSPFADQICIDEVETIKRDDDIWILKTKNGSTYSANTLVAATPFDVSCALLNKTIGSRTKVNASMQHIRGTPKKQYCITRYNVLDPSDTNAFTLVDCDDGTYLLFSHKEKADPSAYFAEYEIIDYQLWNHAGFAGFEPIDSCIDDNLYIIGDYNVLNMEAAFTSGIFAANEILKHQQ